MLDKTKLNKVNEIINLKNNKELINQIGKVNGLISAYDITKNVDILEEAFNQVLSLIEQMNSTTNIVESNKTSKVIVGDKFFADFIIYLRSYNLGEATIGGYIRAIKRVISKYNFDSIDELIESINEIIEEYAHDENESEKYHNVHISALRKLRLYIYTISEDKYFVVFYKNIVDVFASRETFHIDERDPWEILKMIENFIDKIRNKGAVQIYVTYSDEETRVPEYLLNLANRTKGN